MTYNTENRKEPSRSYVAEKSSGVMWLIAGLVIVIAIIALMVWGGSSTTPVSTTTPPQVENNVTVDPSTQPAPNSTTNMEAAPPADAPATTNQTPAPAEVPSSPAPAEQPATNP